MTPLKKTKARRIAARQHARKQLASIVSGDCDIYEAYRSLYSLWCSNNAAVQELRPLFQMPGIAPDGQFSVNDQFLNEVVEISRTILPQFES